MNILWAFVINVQKSDASNDNHLKKFQVHVKTLDDYNANILDLIPCLLEEEVKKNSTKKLEMQTKQN